jgi:hypothetical protein
MTERWQERRIEDELLKRELFLRLCAKQNRVPGRSTTATAHFRRRVRRLLLRHPLFALRFYPVLIDAGLWLFESRQPAYLGNKPTRAGANAVPTASLGTASAVAGQLHENL